jgi:hypothetical protein
MDVNIHNKELLFKRFADSTMEAIRTALLFHKRGDYASASAELRSAEYRATRTYEEFIKLRDLLSK